MPDHNALRREDDEAIALIPAFLRRNIRNIAFAQIVDLVERLAAFDGRTYIPIGRGTDPRNEALSLSSNLEMSFHAGPVDQIVNGPDGMQVRVSFFGLGGADGPLPEAYLDLVLRALYARDSTAVDFLDIFHHRLLSLLYRAENEFRFAHPFRSPQHSPSLTALLSLTGAQAFGRNDASARSDLRATLLGHADIAARRRRSMSDLLTLLSERFDVPVSGSEFTGCWRELPSDLQTVLGPNGSNDLLGISTTMGDRAWNQNAAITLHFGPLSMTQFLDLIPSGHRHAELSDLLNYYLGPQISCCIELELEKMPDIADPIRELGHPQQLLGYTAWLDSPTAEGSETDAQTYTEIADERVCRFWMNQGTSPDVVDTNIDVAESTGNDHEH